MACDCNVIVSVGEGRHWGAPSCLRKLSGPQLRCGVCRKWRPGRRRKKEG